MVIDAMKTYDPPTLPTCDKIDLTNITFALPEDFVAQYRGKQPDWGFGPIGYVTAKRTYCRYILEESRTEEWWEVCKRVTEGEFEIQKRHCLCNKLPWYEDKAIESAKITFDLIWKFKFTPPGRGLWMMGTKFVKERGSLALNNCGFASTNDIAILGSTIFGWIMDCLMQGVGIGFDTKGANKIIIKSVEYSKSTFIIPDSREGWVTSLMWVLDAFFFGERPIPIFDYSIIRPMGTPIKGFGGVASGPAPLREMLINLETLLSKRANKPLTSVNIVDICNYIAKCVVAGNVRRSAEIALGDADDEEYITCKNDSEAVYDRRWASNNSVFAYPGMDYTKFIKSITKNGEPGFIYLDNARAYSRMGYAPDWKDKNVDGVNPCFAGFEKLLTVNGEIPFSDLDNKQITIVTPVGNAEGKVWCSGTKQTIKLTFGDFQTLTLTPDHVLMTADGEEIHAKDSLNARIRIHKEPVTHHNQLWVKLGFIQGDGQLTRLKENNRHRGIEINIGKNDTDIKKLFNYSDIDFDKSNRKVYTTEFTSILKEYDFDPEILPERVMPTKLPHDKELSFLRGMFSANGTVILCTTSAKASKISYKTTCKTLAEQIVSLLSQNGIVSHITTNKPRTAKFSNGDYLCRESYNINITQIRSIVNFYENINFVQQYKTERLEQIIIAKSPKVIKIENAETQKVYDFEAKNVHWGFVNGFLVHNCGEQNLVSFELCCLCEIYMPHHESYEDFQRTLKYAYLYAKTVTLINTNWPITNSVMATNRRIGISQSGIIDAFAKFGRRMVLNWCDRGYDYLKAKDFEYSTEWLHIPVSRKITTVKPSGTVSLIAGTSPGIHYPHSEYYIRRIRFAANDPMLKELIDCGYNSFGDPYQEIKDGGNVIGYRGYCVDFPVHEKNFSQSKDDATIWEQVANAIDYQHHWSDNAVSITVSFKQHEISIIPFVLHFCEDKLKGLSLTPLKDAEYKAAPYEKITKEQFETISAKITRPPNFSNIRYVLEEPTVKNEHIQPFHAPTSIEKPVITKEKSDASLRLNLQNVQSFCETMTEKLHIVKITGLEVAKGDGSGCKNAKCELEEEMQEILQKK